MHNTLSITSTTLSSSITALACVLDQHAMHFCKHDSQVSPAALDVANIKHMEGGAEPLLHTQTAYTEHASLCKASPGVAHSSAYDMAPPRTPAEFPVKVLFDRTVAPPVTLRAPPSRAALFQLMLHAVMFANVAPLADRNTPPPLPPALHHRPIIKSHSQH